MIHFWRKPGKTLIYLLSLFMMAGLLGTPVYAQPGEGDNTTGTDQTAENTGNGNTGESMDQTGNGVTGGVIPGDNAITDGKITVKLQDGAPEALKAYLAEHPDELIIDVYKVEDAKKDTKFDTYTYTPVEGFAVDGFDLSTYDGLKQFTAEKWEELTEKLAEKVVGKTISHDTATYNVQKKDLHHGIYLILAHGNLDPYYETRTTTIPSTEEGKPDKVVTETLTIFETDTNRYFFKPVLVAVPSTNEKTDEEMKTSDGPWKFELDVYLKPEEAPLYGSLTINKKIVTLNNRPIDEKWITPVTVVFRINGWKDEKKTGEPFYSNYASITIPNGTPVTVEHIPVGTYVEVEEEYTGAGYTRVLDGEGPILTAVIPAPDAGTPQVTFTFKDTYNDELKKGYGIMNTFTKTDADNWSWKNDVGQNSSGTNPAEGGPQ